MLDAQLDRVTSFLCLDAPGRFDSLPSIHFYFENANLSFFKSSLITMVIIWKNLAAQFAQNTSFSQLFVCPLDIDVAEDKSLQLHSSIAFAVTEPFFSQARS